MQTNFAALESFSQRMQTDGPPAIKFGEPERDAFGWYIPVSALMYSDEAVYNEVKRVIPQGTSNWKILKRLCRSRCLI